MSEQNGRNPLIDVPDPGKLEEHGVSIDAPTPTQIVMPDPWAQSANGVPPANPDPASLSPANPTQADE